MKPEVVIFDLDGTILDTLGDLTDSVNYALNKADLPSRSEQEVRSFAGNGIFKLIERASGEGVPDKTRQYLYEIFCEYYAEHCADRTKPYDMITELIQSLRSEGIKTAVVSNKGDFAVQQLIRDYFPELFDYVVGERQGIARKPAPDSVNEVLSFLGCDRSKAVYVGDSEVDVLTAKNAQMKMAIVTWGFRDATFLKESGALNIVSTVPELKEFLFDIQ